MATPTLNWKELALLIGNLAPEVEGLFVERVIVLERPAFPEGYVKGEWAIRLTGRKAQPATLVFSVRARNPYVFLSKEKGIKAASRATHSAFDLAMSKHLKGAKLNRFQVLNKERIVTLWLNAPEYGKDQELGLVLSLIPSVPEAFLVTRGSDSENGPWPILMRSRPRQDDSQALYHPPDGSRAPSDIAVRAELVAKLQSYCEAVESALKEEGFDLRLKNAERVIRDLIKQARDRSRQSETALKEAGQEADWQKYGDLMKASLHNLPELIRKGDKAHRMIEDYSSDEKIEVPADPKLSPADQLKRFYQLARRKSRRLEEARNRFDHFEGISKKLEKTLSHLPKPGDWAGLEELEKQVSTLTGAPSVPQPGTKDRSKPQILGWAGKSFQSKDGMPILVGRNKNENLDLTFKHARGNDLWLHVRGRPGAHVIVPVPTGKSAPLETLLDAATLAIYYSGGEKWGKTEVDYTFKKHVKRIKDSTEASYTHNKTLIIEIDPQRLKRLLGAATG